VYKDGEDHKSQQQFTQYFIAHHATGFGLNKSNHHATVEIYRRKRL
jgi:hypothetical protein